MDKSIRLRRGLYETFQETCACRKAFGPIRIHREAGKDNRQDFETSKTGEKEDEISDVPCPRADLNVH